MGLLLNFFRRGKAQQRRDTHSTDLAFVLLKEPCLPEPDPLIEVFGTLEPSRGRIERVLSGDDATEQEILTFRLETGESAFVALVPCAVPNGEADGGAQFSVGSIGTGWTLPSHSAHLLVTSIAPATMPGVERLSRFTSLLAAVAKTSSAVGVYWGNAGATHGVEFFTSVAAEQGVVPRIMLWTGVNIAREKDGRLSFLSLGMQQLNLPDLLLVAPASSAKESLEIFFDLLSYQTERGKAIPEGDTVGRSANEKLPVHYVKSPVDSGKKVWRVELQ